MDQNKAIAMSLQVVVLMLCKNIEAYTTIGSKFDVKGYAHMSIMAWAMSPLVLLLY